MAYAFNNDKSKTVVVSKETDLIIINKESVTINANSSKTIDISDLDNVGAISNKHMLVASEIIWSGGIHEYGTKPCIVEDISKLQEPGSTTVTVTVRNTSSSQISGTLRLTFIQCID